MEKFERMADVDCAPPTVRLVAVSGVEGNASEYLAANRRPWLSLEPISIFAPGRWFRMRYRLGLYDRPVRPLVSYRRGSEEIGWHLLPGPVLGRADWFSVVPAEATAVWISPVSEPGRFCFNVEEIEPLSSLALLRMGLAGNRGRFLSAVGAWLLGWRKEAKENLRWSIQGAPLTAWPAYRDRLSVAARLDEFESPRCDWARAPAARLLVRLDTDTTAARIDETIAALRDQLYPRWTLTILGTSDDAEVNGRLNSWLTKDARLAVRNERLELDGDDTDFVAFVEFGDRLAPHALACFIEASQRGAGCVGTLLRRGDCDGGRPRTNFQTGLERPFAGRKALYWAIDVDKARPCAPPDSIESSHRRERLCPKRPPWSGTSRHSPYPAISRADETKTLRRAVRNLVTRAPSRGARNKRNNRDGDAQQ
ncbi:MAG TPA: hypothetical protein VHT48_08025 [Methylocella sp.]|nr:hypothetical protein [Methylocella sp.]